MKKNFLTIMFAAVFTIATLFVVSCGDTESDETTDEVQTEVTENAVSDKAQTALLMGMVYYTTIPLFELNNYAKFDGFLSNLSEKENIEDLFSPNGALISQFRRVGDKMVATGIKNYRPEDKDWAYGRALEMGATLDQANDVSSKMNNGNSDIISYGKELLWLAEVLPDYVKDEKYKFYNTGTLVRNTIREQLPLIRETGYESVNEVLNKLEGYLIFVSAIIIFEYLDN